MGLWIVRRLEALASVRLRVGPRGSSFFFFFKQKTAYEIVSVPSRGGGDIVTGLLTGTTPVAIVGLPNFIAHIRSGTVKALAVDSDMRSPLFPDVPTLNELGFPNLAPVYFAFVAPARTPRPV